MWGMGVGLHIVVYDGFGKYRQSEFLGAQVSPPCSGEDPCRAVSVPLACSSPSSATLSARTIMDIRSCLHSDDDV